MCQAADLQISVLMTETEKLLRFEYSFQNLGLEPLYVCVRTFMHGKYRSRPYTVISQDLTYLRLLWGEAFIPSTFEAYCPAYPLYCVLKPGSVHSDYADINCPILEEGVFTNELPQKPDSIQICKLEWVFQFFTERNVRTRSFVPSENQFPTVNGDVPAQVRGEIIAQRSIRVIRGGQESRPF
jgi:hypothetical protein